MKAELEAANEHLSAMISAFKSSMADLQKADKSRLAATAQTLQEHMQGFIARKKALDAKLLATAQANPGADLSALLSKDESEQLSAMRLNLSTVASLNSEYASLIMSLKDFYDEVISECFGLEDDYSKYFKNRI